MSSQLIKDLLLNTALLLSISIVYNLFLIHLDSRKKWLEAVLGLFLGGEGITWSAFLANNLLPVTLGNLLGGAGMVGFVYHVIYRREPP